MLQPMRVADARRELGALYVALRKYGQAIEQLRKIMLGHKSCTQVAGGSSFPVGTISNSSASGNVTGGLATDILVGDARESLAKVPWVRAVALRRSWPKTLEITVTEHEPPRGRPTRDTRPFGSDNRPHGF
jgi:hypothetical protein